MLTMATALLWAFAADLMPAQADSRPSLVTLPASVAVEGRTIQLPRGPAAEPVVLAWTARDCPMAKVYAPRVRALATEWNSRGVRFFIVDSSPGAAVPVSAPESGPMATVVRDPQGELARRVGARSTTEVILFDRMGQVAYRGALDDQYGFRRGDGPGPRTWRKDAPTQHYLTDALEAVLAGRSPAIAETDPLGCLLAASADLTGPVPAVIPGEPVFHAGTDGVEAIFRRSCQDCHRQGGNAPFALENYDDIRRRALMIQQVVEERRMPPWSASPKHGVFANDPTLAPADMAKLLAWLNGSHPRGDVAAALPPPPERGEWDIGTPDTVISAKPYMVAAEGRLPYRYVRIRTNFDEDRWVDATQIVSTAPELVHHVLIFIEGGSPAPKGVQRPWTPAFDPLSLLEGSTAANRWQIIERNRPYMLRDLRAGGGGGGGGLNGSFATSLAAGRGLTYPPGRAKLLPRHATVVFQIHYTPDGRQRESTTRLGLHFASSPPTEPMDSRSLATVAFEIPPGASAHEVTATKVLPRDALLLSLRPHMHLRGKSFIYTAEFADGHEQVLLEVPKWEFEWQSEYVLAKPILLPKGTRLRARATYDNSAANPANPDPSKTVYFGLQSEEEMMIGYFEVVWQSEKKAPAAPGTSLDPGR